MIRFQPPNIRHPIATAIVVALLVSSIATLLGGAILSSTARDNLETFGQELSDQLSNIYALKQSLTPTQQKIDWKILQVAQEINDRILAVTPGQKPSFEDLSTPFIKTDSEGNIEVKLYVIDLDNERLLQIEALGMSVSLILQDYGIIEGSLPYYQIEMVANLEFVARVDAPSYPLYHTGGVNSAGDSVLGAEGARSAFGVDGTGSKIGVISDGVDHLANSVASGDLPSSPAVDVLKAGSGDEGV